MARVRPKGRQVELPIQDHNISADQAQEELPYPEQPPRVFFLKQTTRPRKWCLELTKGPYLYSCSYPPAEILLECVSFIMCVVGCVVEGMYKPGEKSTTLEALGNVVFLYFTVEFIIMTIALGKAVLDSNWNKFDIVITIAAVVDFLLNVSGIHVGLYNALNPARLIGKIPGLRKTVSHIASTLPMFTNAALLFSLVIAVFGVLGVQLWAGEMRNRCFLGEDIAAMYNISLSPYYMTENDDARPFLCSTDPWFGMQHCSDVPPYIENGSICSLLAPHLTDSVLPSPNTTGCINWNVFYNVCRAGDFNPNKGVTNFDNIGYASLTVFQVTTMEGWTDIMYQIMDCNSAYSFIFFVILIVVGTIIVLNVCAIITAVQFAEAAPNEEGPASGIDVYNMFLSLLNWLWMISNRGLEVCATACTMDNRIRKLSPFNIINRTKVKEFVEHHIFTQGILLTVILSVLTLASVHQGQPQTMTDTLQILNWIFSFIFLVEMILKLLALSCAYFKDSDNLLDFIIVLISLWEIFSNADSKLSVVRSLRVLRVLRVIKFLPDLKRQLTVLTKTMGQANSLLRFMLLFTFCFSIMGMHLFGGKFSFVSQDGEPFVDRKNFDTLLWSMVTVFQILTLEDWNFVLYNAMAATNAFASLYLVVLIMLGKNFLLNVLVGMVVDNFLAHPDEEDEAEDSVAASRQNLENQALELVDLSEAPETSRPKGRMLTWSYHAVNTRFLNFLTRQRFSAVVHNMKLWHQPREDWSLYLLSPENRCRVFLNCLVSHKAFDFMIVAFILMSFVTIAIERPSINDESLERWLLDISSYVFSAVFMVEMLVKVLAWGFLFGRNSYCRFISNIIDGLLVLLSFVQIIFNSVHAGNTDMLSMLKVIRLLRILRTLRMIKISPKLRLAVEALLKSMKPMASVALLCGMFLFFYAVLGVQLFKGKFYYCEGEDTRNIVDKNDCLLANYHWVKQPYNFDHLFQALMAAFVMFSTDGWLEIMHNTVDAVGVDQQPVRNYNEWMVLYSVSFMILSFCLLDMFIGIMAETFHKCQQSQEQAEGPIEEEEPNSQIVPAEEFENYSDSRQQVYELCTSNFMELFINVVIVLSVVLMALEHYNQHEFFDQLREKSFIGVTVILIFEVFLKMMAFGFCRYCKSRWNAVDFIVLLLSIVSIILPQINLTVQLPINPSILRVFRVLRLAQVLKNKRIRVLLQTIMKTMNQFGNILLLFMFFFFIYAALGVQLFGKLACTLDYPCSGLQPHSNFQHFGLALLTLFKVCTGDNWSGILKDTMRECRPSDADCWNYLRYVSPGYFFTFVVIVQFVLTNLVVAVIIQAVQDSQQDSHSNTPNGGS